MAKEQPNVTASKADIAGARVRVYGKAQNRTALGIMHAYMVMYPQAKLEDLKKAFPKELNPDFHALYRISISIFVLIHDLRFL